VVANSADPGIHSIVEAEINFQDAALVNLCILVSKHFRVASKNHIVIVVKEFIETAIMVSCIVSFRICNMASEKG